MIELLKLEFKKNYRVFLALIALLTLIQTLAKNGTFFTVADPFSFSSSFLFILVFTMLSKQNFSAFLQLPISALKLAIFRIALPIGTIIIYLLAMYAVNIAFCSCERNHDELRYGFIFSFWIYMIASLILLNDIKDIYKIGKKVGMALNAMPIVLIFVFIYIGIEFIKHLPLLVWLLNLLNLIILTVSIITFQKRLSYISFNKWRMMQRSLKF